MFNQIILLYVLTGVEFLASARAFYCTLCSTFAGDSACAEEHLKSETHNEQYRVSAVGSLNIHILSYSAHIVRSHLKKFFKSVRTEFMMFFFFFADH